MTDQEIDTGKNLVTQAEIIHMLKREKTDLKESLKSMEAQLLRLTDAVCNLTPKGTHKLQVKMLVWGLLLHRRLELKPFMEVKLKLLRDMGTMPKQMKALTKPKYKTRKGKLLEGSLCPLSLMKIGTCQW